jgi:hypothetical protein
MFDSLDDQIKHDLQRESTPTERWIRYGVVAVVSVLLFGGLILGVQLLS